MSGPNRAQLDRYRPAQDIARAVLSDIETHIRPGASERSLHEACHALMLAHGATGFWGNTPAIVLSGSRLRSSVFDSSYRPSDESFGQDGMITIDVGPRIDDRFGDSARTYFMQGGRLVTPEQAGEAEADGMRLEHRLHAELVRRARPNMSFAELFLQMDALVAEAGYENLDLLANYGHSLETDVADFLPLDHTNHRPLGSVSFFTFEPHIARPGSPLGFKLEEAYYVDGDRLAKL